MSLYNEPPIAWPDILNLAKQDPTVAAVLNAHQGASRESLLCHMVWHLVRRCHETANALCEIKMKESRPLLVMKEGEKD